MKVTGLTPNVQVTVTVGSTQDGYVPGSSTITGASLNGPLNPIFGDVTRNGDGFSTKITNYVNGYAYPATIIDPASPPQGYSAAVEVGEGGFHYLVVSGLPPRTPKLRSE